MTKPIGSDFVSEVMLSRVYCSECSRIIEKGETALVSRKNKRVMKRVCSEECRLEFDNRFWQAAATTNAKRKGRDPQLEDADREWRDGEAHGRDD